MLQDTKNSVYVMRKIMVTAGFHTFVTSGYFMNFLLKKHSIHIVVGNVNNVNS